MRQMYCRRNLVYRKIPGHPIHIPVQLIILWKESYLIRCLVCNLIGIFSRIQISIFIPYIYCLLTALVCSRIMFCHTIFLHGKNFKLNFFRLPVQISYRGECSENPSFKVIPKTVDNYSFGNCK